MCCERSYIYSMTTAEEKLVFRKEELIETFHDFLDEIGMASVKVKFQQIPSFRE